MVVLDLKTHTCQGIAQYPMHTSYERPSVWGKLLLKMTPIDQSGFIQDHQSTVVWMWYNRGRLNVAVLLMH
jgi:hypothetical protein